MFLSNTTLCHTVTTNSKQSPTERPERTPCDSVTVVTDVTATGMLGKKYRVFDRVTRV